MKAGAPRTIACSSCGAPAVLSVVAERQCCSSCRAPLVLPVEVRAELYAAARVIGSKLELARHLDVATGRVLQAEQSTLLFAVGLVLLLCGGLHGLNLLAVLHQGLDRPWAIVPAAAGLATAFGVAIATFAAHRLVRRSLSRTFAARAAGPGAPYGACHACGGPLPGARGGSIRCEYCGCDNLLGATAVIRQAADLGAELSTHADDMLSAMNRARVWTKALGFGALLMIPLLSLAAWVLLDWLVGVVVAAT